MLERARELQDQLIAWRRDFHRHPELSFQEHRTAHVVADTLRAMGLRVETGVGRTGVVAYIGEGRPAVGIRADMDALPIQEANAVPYASENPGVMHACGHDAHTAILLGTARLLSEMAGRPHGEVRLLFQPSEEDWDDDLKSGATRMIEDGALEGLDAVIALHVASDTPSGKIRITSGYDAAAVDAFYATISGKGCHGAYPHKGADPIFILAQVINVIHGIRARRIDPIQPMVISIGSVHAGEATNVIPDQVRLSGTIRSFDEKTRRMLWAELESALAVSRSLGGDYTLKIEQGYPAMYNDPEIANLIRSAATEIVGADAVIAPEPGMGSEDFAYMVQKAPGAMFVLGAKPNGPDRPHHSPIFDIDETAMPVGVAVLAQTACLLLEGKAR